MNPTQTEFGKIQWIAWGSGLIFITALFLLLNLFSVAKPSEQNVPGFELLNWVRQVYKAPMQTARVRERMGERAVRKITGIDDQLKKSLQTLRPRQQKRGQNDKAQNQNQQRIIENRDIISTDRNVERQVTRGSNRDLDFGDRNGSSDRDHQGVALGFGDGLQQDIAANSKNRSNQARHNFDRFLNWDNALSYWDISNELAAFTPCGGARFKGAEILLDGKRWRAWVCPPAPGDSKNAINSMLLRHEDKLMLFTMSGDNLELQGLKEAELVRSNSGFTIISQHSRLADGGSLHNSFIQFLENN
jgi:hypothetical protein